MEDRPSADRSSPPDPGSLLRSRDYRVLLALAALIGVLVSLASWGYLELIHYLQQWLYKDLPSGLDLSPVPTWWPLPVLAVASVPIAFALARMPGSGGHKPAEGLKAGPPTQPNQLPGVVLASLASIGFGMVLGPEAPLIAIAGGLGILAVRSARKDAPDQVLALIAGAASFAAMSSLFGSPIVGAVIIIEAAGLGGATLPVILLPGLLAAGIGSLVFIGMGSLTGLSSSAYAIAPLSLPKYHAPTLSAFGWTIVLAAIVAVGIFAIARIGLVVNAATSRRPFVVVPLAALTVGVLAIAFGHFSGKPEDLVLFSGQDTMGAVVNQAASFSQTAFALFLIFKGLAYGVSLGSARGGPTFPAMFLGIVAGLLCAHLPGFSEAPAVAALMGAGTVSILRLPLASIIIAMVVSQAGASTTPLIIVAVVVAYLVVLALSASRPSTDPKHLLADSRSDDGHAASPGISTDELQT
ncbi:MAG: chloride channel protein [Acidimicrobiales bacterium]|jgi:H+/Cl- antiporter ClcA